jgi:HSP20 family protein
MPISRGRASRFKGRGVEHFGNRQYPFNYGERKLADEGKDVRYHRREREAGSFSRIISLPGEVDADRIEADLKNGMLTVRIPKAEAAKPKKITVK